MRLRYKIFVVVASFVAFYAGIGPVSHACFDPDSDCHFAARLWEMTRVTVPVGSDGGIGEWSGTAQGIEEPSVKHFVSQNVMFLFTMVAAPTCIICVLILFERR